MWVAAWARPVRASSSRCQSSGLHRFDPPRRLPGRRGDGGTVRNCEMGGRWLDIWQRPLPRRRRLLAGCGASDSTVSKTPEADAPRRHRRACARDRAACRRHPQPHPAAAADPCAVNLRHPRSPRPSRELPRDPRSGQAWNPEPLAGNYNECAQLSAVIVKANTNAENPNTRAVLFHLGKFIPTGVPDTYGFNGIDAVRQHRRHRRAEVLQRHPGLDSVVKFRWNGSGVELIGNTPG